MFACEIGPIFSVYLFLLIHFTFLLEHCDELKPVLHLRRSRFPHYSVDHALTWLIGYLQPNIDNFVGGGGGGEIINWSLDDLWSLIRENKEQLLVDQISLPADHLNMCFGRRGGKLIQSSDHLVTRTRWTID